MKWMIGLLSVACALPALAGTLYVGVGPEVTPRKLQDCRRIVRQVQQAGIDLDNADQTALMDRDLVKRAKTCRARIASIPDVPWSAASDLLPGALAAAKIAKLAAPSLDCQDFAAVNQRAKQVCTALGSTVTAVRAGKRAQFACAAMDEQTIWGVEVCDE